MAAIFDKTLRAVEVDDADTAALALTTAKLYDERLEDLDRAGYFYQRALTLRPEQQGGRPSARVGVLPEPQVGTRFSSWTASARALPTATTSGLPSCTKIARVEVDELENPEGGIVTYRRILEIDPVNTEAVTRLDQLLEGAERWDELGAHIEFQIDNASDARAASRFASAWAC